jgi:hypothetical protein
VAQNPKFEKVLNRAFPAIRAAAVSRFTLAIGAFPMLETARIGRIVWFLQGCSSVGRVPVSKTGCRRFEPCRPCQALKSQALKSQALKSQALKNDALMALILTDSVAVIWRSPRVGLVPAA